MDNITTEFIEENNNWKPYLKYFTAPVLDFINSSNTFKQAVYDYAVRARVCSHSRYGVDAICKSVEINR